MNERMQPGLIPIPSEGDSMNRAVYNARTNKAVQGPAFLAARTDVMVCTVRTRRPLSSHAHRLRCAYDAQYYAHFINARGLHSRTVAIALSTNETAAKDLHFRLDGHPVLSSGFRTRAGSLPHSLSDSPRCRRE
jgi:hypothetical protein